MIPARVGGGASPSPGNPFMSTAAPAATTSAAPDPFAKLATGLLAATPQSNQPHKKMDKSDFFPEIPKPSLLHLSKQQQQQQEQEQAEQQTNVDLFGATPVSIDIHSRIQARADNSERLNRTFIRLIKG